jgi:hypothetical protein
LYAKVCSSTFFINIVFRFDGVIYYGTSFKLLIVSAATISNDLGASVAINSAL